MKKKTIVYIAGEGHSGSTLLDIILGSQKKTFSAGELIFFPGKGIKNNEYCACGYPVNDCDLWSKIIVEWDKKRKLDLDAFIQTQKSIVSNKNILFAQKKLISKPKQIELFLEDTKSLYELIFSHTNSDTIVNSSKAPGYIPILKELDYNIIVIHIKRRFGDVLNSYKKHTKKDLKAGIEHEMKPAKTSAILRSWLLKNTLTKVYSKNLKYILVKYEDYIYRFEETISRVVDNPEDFQPFFEHRGPFNPKHLVAGNKIRMNKEIYIADKPLDSSYGRLKGIDKNLAKVIDAFY